MPPMILYHSSPIANRASILAHGLLTKYDETGDEQSIKGVYLTDKPGDRADTYAVDVAGLELEEDWTTQQDIEEFGNWYVVYQDIPPERLRLVSA